MQTRKFGYPAERICRRRKGFERYYRDLVGEMERQAKGEVRGVKE